MSDVGDALQTIADYSNDIFWHISGDFDELLFVNDSYETLWGHPTEKLAANPRSMLDGVYPPHRDRVEAAIDRVRAGEKADLEFRVNPTDDYSRWVWVQGTPVEDETDADETIVGIAKDVTDRKQREEELALFQRMIDESNALVFVNDVQSAELVYVNQTACDRLGYDRPELLGKTVPEIESSFDSRSEWEAHIDELRERGRMRFRGDQERKDGSTIPVEVNLSYLDLDSQYMVAIARDISERLERERELTRQNERLERLTSVASHDLQNPLNVASGRLALAREDCECPHLDDVASAIDRMDTLIGDLLTMARSGKVIQTTDEISLTTLASESWANVQTGAATLNVESDSTVVGNRSRLKQLFENLFTNAVEHGSTSPRSQTPGDAVEHGSTSPRSRARGDAIENGGSEVTVSVGDLDDGFYVEDEGQGIPADRREEVFEYGVTTTANGTGFGLAIVREIVNAHGWNIRVSESDAGGARFEITGVEVRDT